MDQLAAGCALVTQHIPISQKFACHMSSQIAAILCLHEEERREKRLILLWEDMLLHGSKAERSG